MAPSPLDKQAAGCDSPDDWLMIMSLAMDLAICVICGGESGTNGCHLAVFTVDIAFAHHFMATRLPPIGVFSGIGYTSKRNI